MSNIITSILSGFFSRPVLPKALSTGQEKSKTLQEALLKLSPENRYRPPDAVNYSHRHVVNCIFRTLFKQDNCPTALQELISNYASPIPICKIFRLCFDATQQQHEIIQNNNLLVERIRLLFKEFILDCRKDINEGNIESIEGKEIVLHVVTNKDQTSISGNKKNQGDEDIRTKVLSKAKLEKIFMMVLNSQVKKINRENEYKEIYLSVKIKKVVSENKFKFCFITNLSS
ncbi:MAG: hypothetical protein AAF443_01795 [Chlamydiota bacterium]